MPNLPRFPFPPWVDISKEYPGSSDITVINSRTGEELARKRVNSPPTSRRTQQLAKELLERTLEWIEWVGEGGPTDPLEVEVRIFPAKGKKLRTPLYPWVYAIKWARYLGPTPPPRHHPLVERSFKKATRIGASELERNLLMFSDRRYHEEINLYFRTLDTYVTLALSPEALYPNQISSLMLELEPYMMSYARNMKASSERFRAMTPEEVSRTIFIFGSREEFAQQAQDLYNKITAYYMEARRGGREADWRVALDQIMGLHHILGTILDGALEAFYWRGDMEGFLIEEDLVSLLGEASMKILDYLRDR